MNRRQFFRKVAGNGAKVAGVVSAGALAAREAAPALPPQLREMPEQLAHLRDRMEQMEKRHQRLVRAGIVVLGVSTGIDLSLML